MILVSFVVFFINIGWNGLNGYFIGPTDSTNYTKLFCFIRYIRWLPFIVDFYHLIARITRISFLVTWWTRWTWWLAQCTVWLNLVHLVIIFLILFVPFVLSVGKIIICCWINFCPRKSKHTNSYNFLIIIGIRCTIPIKSPKIHPKSLLLYIFFANFFLSHFQNSPTLTM